VEIKHNKKGAVKMKKTKVIALVLCAAIMLMGAGYAYWSDTLTINNTVSTGELNVVFDNANGANVTRGGDDQSGYIPGTNKGKWYYEAYVKHEGLNGGTITTITDGGKTVNTVVTNMYPGAYAQYYGTIVNKGTIPAVFNNAAVSFKGLGATLTAQEEELKSNMKFAIGYKIVDAAGLPVVTHPTTGDGRFWASGTMDQFDEKIETLFANVRLEPGHKILLDFASEKDAQDAMASIGYPYNPDMHCITYTLSTNADDDVENTTLGIEITLNWKQHNQ
jgi:predicted ribosomally synthesized peptide with SipW-like signal peptide